MNRRSSSPAVAFESLEDRRLLAASIISVTPTPNPVERGIKLTLTSNGATSDTKSVVFFTDANGNGVLDSTDKRIGRDLAGRNGFNWRLNTKKLALGQIRFFAEPHAASGAAGTPVSTVVTITDAPPTIKSLRTNFKTFHRGKTITLTAAGVKDSDGKVGSVAFFLDSNQNGTFDTGVDTFLAPDPDPKGGFKYQPDTNALPLGTQTFFAIATDNDGGTSNAASVAVTVLA